jgi:hypothetical protein
MEIEIYTKGKQFIAKSLKELDKTLKGFEGSNPTDEELTNIRFEIIVAMLNDDPQLYKQLKTYFK